MKSDSQEKFAGMMAFFRKATDALTRACDGATVENWDRATLGYTQTQLLRANKAICDALEAINAEVNGRTEGATKKQIIDDLRQNGSN